MQGILWMMDQMGTNLQRLTARVAELTAENDQLRASLAALGDDTGVSSVDYPRGASDD